MTTLLLDTHAYVWALTRPNRLSGPARTAIEAANNIVFVSAATAWEIVIKYRAKCNIRFCRESSAITPTGPTTPSSGSFPPWVMVQ